MPYTTPSHPADAATDWTARLLIATVADSSLQQFLLREKFPDVVRVLEELCTYNGGTFVSTLGDNSYTFELPEPLRSRKPYLITLVKSDNLATDKANSNWIWSYDDAIKEKVGVSFKYNYYSYAHTQAEGEVAAISAFKKYMTALQEIAVKYGSTRDITFSLICNDKEGKSVAKCRLNGTELTFLNE